MNAQGNTNPPAPDSETADGLPSVAAGGDVVFGDKVGGDKVGGDKITVGDIQGSLAAIGAGAQVIVNHIRQASSTIEELEKEIQVAERRLAGAIRHKIDRYTRLSEHNSAEDLDNPYKALLDYKLEDAPFFYGRAEAIQKMEQLIARSRLAVLHADSGSGKSSLLQAGLASRFLAQGHFPLYLRPYRQRPDQAVRRAFLPDYSRQDELWRFRDDQMSLRGFLERVTHYLGQRQLFVFLDQFEEFFTEIELEGQNIFAAELQSCVESDLPVWWVLSVRKEYFSDLRLFQAVKPFENAYFLPALDPEEAKEVIIEPAALKRVRYENGLIDRILADLHQPEAGVQPPQVQLVCYTLFAEKGEGAELITAAVYEMPRGRGAAGAQGILTGHLSQVLEREMGARQRRLARRVLEALVTSQSRRAVKSKVALMDEVEPASPARLDEVLTTLIDSRLLRTTEGEEDGLLYELAHDYLLAEIELDPETQMGKLAQEMLRQDLWAWEKEQIVIAEDRLVLITKYISSEKLADDERALIERSQIKADQARREKAEQLERELAAQRRLTRRTRVFLLVVSLTAVGLAIAPARRFILREQAKRLAELVEIDGTWVETCADGSDNSLLAGGVICGINARPEQSHFVEPFEIERRLVTNAQYRRCVKAGVCSVPENEPYRSMGIGDDPVRDIDAVQAGAYCKWTGRYLPTELQWELASIMSSPGELELSGDVSEWTRSYDPREPGSGDREMIWDGTAEGLRHDNGLIVRGGKEWLDTGSRQSIPGLVNDEIFGVRCVLQR